MLMGVFINPPCDITKKGEQWVLIFWTFSNFLFGKFSFLRNCRVLEGHKTSLLWKHHFILSEGYTKATFSAIYDPLRKEGG